jgi:hypothetical protein
VVENADGHGASSCYIVLLHRPAAAIKYVFVQVVAHTVYHTLVFTVRLTMDRRLFHQLFRVVLGKSTFNMTAIIEIFLCLVYLSCPKQL